MRVLGIDPGSRVTGYSCLETAGSHVRLVAHGALRLSNSDENASQQEQRLLRLYEELCAVIQTYRPDVLVLEKIFFAKNAASALKLGQARGVVLLCAAKNGLMLFEYSATEVKKSMTGYGRADKKQMAHMIQLLFGQQKFMTHDASDAVALALCHIYGAQNHRWNELKSELKPRKKSSLAQSLRHRIDVKAKD